MLDKEEKKMVENYLDGVWMRSKSFGVANKPDTVEGLVYEGAMSSIRAMGYMVSRIGGRHVVTKRRLA